MPDTTTDILAALVEAGGSDLAPEPMGLVMHEIVHPGNADVPVPIVVSTLVSAGHVYIYDTRTGDRSLANMNMLPAQLKKVRPDGSRVFTIAKPSVAPIVGHIRCLLHELAVDRLKYTALGFATCLKDNLISEFHLERHMARTHRAEWAAIKDSRDKAEKAEDRAFLRQALEGRRPAGKKE